MIGRAPLGVRPLRAVVGRGESFGRWYLGGESLEIRKIPLGCRYILFVSTETQKKKRKVVLARLPFFLILRVFKW